MGPVTRMQMLQPPPGRPTVPKLTPQSMLFEPHPPAIGLSRCFISVVFNVENCAEMENDVWLLMANRLGDVV